jgi:hypothetical protein
MPGNTTSKTAIKNRLNTKLTKADRDAITRCLVQHMVDQDMKAGDLGSSDELLDELLPLLSKWIPDWVGIAHTRELKDTEIRRSFL